MSKTNAIDALRRAEHSAWGRAGAYIVMKEEECAGKIKIAYPQDGAGTVTVFVWDFDHDLQTGKAGGYGYDKVSAALSGLQFHEITFTDHPENWEAQLRKADYTLIQAL